MRAMAQESWSKGAPLCAMELKAPEPRPDEVRVAVKAIGVNPVDWKMRSLGPLRIAARALGPPPPIVVGIDFAGIVDAVGSLVTSVRPGDAVCGGTNFSRGQRGSYADTVVVREDQLCILPAGFDLEVAGALPVTGVTAWMSVVDIGGIGVLKAGEEPPRALILGASGGVGQLAVQVAKSRGAFVVGVCSSRNTDLVRALGADVVLDYTSADPLVAAQPHAPFQVIVDCVGGYSGAACRSLLLPGGRHAMVAGDTPAAFLNLLVPPFTSRTVLGRPTGARLKPLVDAIAAGKLQVAIAERLPLAEAERAHVLSRGGRMTGKIVLVP